MLASGFTNAPITQLLLLGIVGSAIIASLTDTKYFLWIEVRPHLLDYWQYWRLLTWQLAYTNSAEVLFAAMTFYQLRVIERLWGSRKFAFTSEADRQVSQSFLVSTYIYTALLPPILLAVIIRPLSWGHINYLPSGPTPLLFALLAQYHAAIPYNYKYRLSSSLPNSASSTQEYGIMLTSKATSYLLPMQLALSQLPGSAIAAGVGWIIGFAHRREILPGTTRWRLPTWLVGGAEQKERYDSLRRRMEGEAGRATGVQTDGAAGQGQTRRRARSYRESNAGKEQYDRIFVKNFNIIMTISSFGVPRVLTQINRNTLYPDHGNIFFTWINVVPDSPQGIMMNTACSDDRTHVQLREGDTDSPSLVVCPRGFKHGCFLGKVWPGVSDITCDSIGPRVSWRMLTLGHFFVQQYTFYQKIEWAALNALGGTTFDLANGPTDVLNIDRYEARVNADIYAWFVTDLAWSIQCGRYFEPPVAGDDDDPK
ncbi:hypothetical protein MBLNU13_g11570t1 [Cladosporium sp. NU13]